MTKRVKLEHLTGRGDGSRWVVPVGWEPNTANVEAKFPVGRLYGTLTLIDGSLLDDQEEVATLAIDAQSVPDLVMTGDEFDAETDRLYWLSCPDNRHLCPLEE